MKDAIEGKDDSEITAKGERTECVDHLFVPDFLRPWTVVDADRGGEWVKYDGGVNYKGGRIESN